MTLHAWHFLFACYAVLMCLNLKQSDVNFLKNMQLIIFFFNIGFHEAVRGSWGSDTQRTAMLNNFSKFILS